MAIAERIREWLAATPSTIQRSVGRWNTDIRAELKRLCPDLDIGTVEWSEREHVDSNQITIQMMYVDPDGVRHTCLVVSPGHVLSEPRTAFGYREEAKRFFIQEIRRVLDVRDPATFHALGGEGAS